MNTNTATDPAKPIDKRADNRDIFGEVSFSEAAKPKRLSPTELQDLKERYAYGSIYPSHEGAMGDAVSLLAHAVASETLIIELAAEKTLAEARAPAGNAYFKIKPDVLNTYANGCLFNFVAALPFGWVLMRVLPEFWHPVPFWACVGGMFLLLVLKDYGK